VGALLREHQREWAVGVPVLGAFNGATLAATAADRRIDRVVVSIEELEDPAVAELLRLCKQLALKVSIVPTQSGLIGPSAMVDHVEGIALIGIHPPVLTRSSRVAKRAIDIAGAATLLVILAPLLAVITVAVKVSSRGPVFFRQRRVGAGGRRFELVKFRTMVADAEARRAELIPLSKDPGWLHLENDPRVTPVGRLLRTTSVDELPQLWNVLKGDMSLVGPRPLIEDEDRKVNGWRRGRLDLTPGITGLWQVLGRTSIPFDEMVKLDYLYVTNWSLWGDISLILRTLPVVLARRGAN
jgi:exopolysaccharide biosynthesis polyprenyl glycosylphosphotransferase